MKPLAPGLGRRSTSPYGILEKGIMQVSRALVYCTINDTAVVQTQKHQTVYNVWSRKVN